MKQSSQKSASRSPPCFQVGNLGYLQGEVKANKNKGELCHYFGGVPYALPPTGPHRWKRPRPLPNNCYGTKDQPQICTSWTGVCPQIDADQRQSVRSHWTEDCLQCNIWIPSGKPPASGWPVLFFIHGGFLQWGHPNNYDPSMLLGETPCKCIIVLPAYRLNVFGFLASHDLQAEGNNTGNYGFWDQRQALEWTVKNITYFGGNKDLVTMGGFSAGGYSAYHQLAYDLLLSDNSKRPYIKRLFVQSNGPGTQPRSIGSAQEQFDELLDLLDIPARLSSEEKMATLRTIPSDRIIEASEKIKSHEFRAVSDDKFVSKLLFDRIDSGMFAGLLRKHNIEILVSEVKDEHTTYAQWRPPESDDVESLRTRLAADYHPEGVVDAIITHCGKDFGKLYADVQVHLSLRGFTDKLAEHGAGHLIRRVRTEWMASTAKRWTKKCMGVTHCTDSPIWFWGNGEKLEDKEKKVMRTFVADTFWRFLLGEDVQSTAWWKALDRPDLVRTLKADGRIVNEPDQYWEDGKRLWEAVREASWSDSCRESWRSGSGQVALFFPKPPSAGHSGHM